MYISCVLLNWNRRVTVPILDINYASMNEWMNEEYIQQQQH